MTDRPVYRPPLVLVAWGVVVWLVIAAVVYVAYT